MTEPAQSMAAQAAPAPAPAPRPWYVSALLAVGAVLLLLAGVWGFARSKSPYPFFGTSYDNTPVAAAFSGTDDRGQPFAFAPDGQTTTALFFGFTHCANICPLTLSYLNKVKAGLPEDQRQNFRVLFVSIDPARDTTARMHSYVTYFGSGTGVVVPEPGLAAAAKAYGVGYQKAEVKGAEYQMNHTTATYLIDRTGHLRAIWDYTQLPQVDRVAADLRYVMEHPVQ